MKYKRQEEIKRIITRYNIETQDELIDRLRDKGIDVTQATVSRDIRELQLIKVALGSGTFKYALPRFDDLNYTAKYQYIIKETVLSVDSAQNLIILKTRPGMAQAAAAAVDGMGWKDIVGTLAGDDTVFLAMRSREKADEYAANLLALRMPKDKGSKAR